MTRSSVIVPSNLTVMEKLGLLRVKGRLAQRRRDAKKCTGIGLSAQEESTFFSEMP